MSIRQRLYPTSYDEVMLRTHGDHARFIYNLAVIQRSYCDKAVRARGGLVTYNTQARELTALRAEYDWLRAGASAVQQDALRDADRAFKNFFESCSDNRAGVRVGFPKLKRKGNELSFTVRIGNGLRRINKKYGEILVPKLGYVKFRITRLWSDICSAKSARITFKNQQWHV